MQSQAVASKLFSQRTTATISNISLAQLNALAVPLPLLPEQQRIVDILDRATAIQKLRKEAGAKAQEIIPALFMDMFGDPVSNPRGWPRGQVRDFFAEKPRYGTMVPASADQKDLLCIRVANIQDDELSRKSLKYVSSKEIDMHRHAVKDGDVLMARAIASRDHLGKCLVAYPGEEKWAFDSHIMLCRLDRSKLLPEYLVRYLQSNAGRQEFLSHTRQSAVQFNITLKRRDLLPEEIQHGVGRGVAIVGAAVHLTAGHNVYAGQLLVENCGLRRAILGIGH